MVGTGTEKTATSERSPEARSGDLARRIVHRCEELGISREELARRAGMDLGYLDYFEQSPGAVLGSDALFRLAKVLETTPASLAGGDIARPPGRGRAGPHPVLETLTREQCEEHLFAGGIGRVVFSAERGPVALPVNFRFVNGHIVFRTATTASVTRAFGTLVSFEIDHVDEAMSEGWSVLLTGRAEHVEDPSELEGLAQLRIEPWAGGVRDVFVRIGTDEITGRVIHQDR